VVSPEHKVANVSFNVRHIKGSITELASKGVNIAVFPELCVTGYSCGDLFYQNALLSKALDGLNEIVKHTEQFKIAVAVGLPLSFCSRIYNCVALVVSGKIIGLVPKSVLPNTKEYYEQRWFTSGSNIKNETYNYQGYQIPFGVDILFSAQNVSDCVLGVEVCEDLWSPQPPSGAMSLEGATIIINSSASNELIGKHLYRRELVKLQSARCNAAYLYSCAGPGESTTDTVCGGHSIIAENGVILNETNRFQFDTQFVINDIDLQQIINERKVNSGFSSAPPSRQFREVLFDMPVVSSVMITENLIRPISAHPFVPFEAAARSEHCKEILLIQTTALAKRLRETNIKNIVIGVSGGLDSTLALLVAINAFDKLNIPRAGIVAITMPGFGTSDRTKNNAIILIERLQVTYKIIDIKAAVLQHFDDIGHDRKLYDVTYENSQARERTQILMDISNQVGGFVLGTGDLSELALGWCTYNGDHMSMYNVNAGIPKTLVRTLVEWCADELFDKDLSVILNDICETPISPELLPLGKDFEINQITENMTGPYELNDFFLFNIVRHKFSKQKVHFLTMHSFKNKYTADTIDKWLTAFYYKFFSQQFKRSAMPDGPKVGSVALSPRGDWRMPSDADCSSWTVE